MNNLVAYLKLVRYTNLIIIVLTQYFFRHFIVLPLYRMENIVPPTGELYFFILVLSTLLIAAAAYAINDYFDMRVDRINKPDKMLLGKIIPRRMAILLHGVCTGLGILLSFIAAFMIGSWKLGFISAIIAFALWQYSFKFKASFITGNFIIALFSSFVIFIVWLFEFYAQINSGYALISGKVIFNSFMLACMFFAFVISFMREIIKDIEDIEGDRRVGCQTIPIKIGIKNSKNILYLFSFINILFLALISLNLFALQRFVLLGYYLIFLIALMIYQNYLIYKANEKADFSYLSIYVKIIMLAGVFSMQLIYILIK